MPPDNMMDNVRCYVPQSLLDDTGLQKQRSRLEEEIYGDYEFSSRKAIGRLSTYIMIITLTCCMPYCSERLVGYPHTL